MQFTNFINRLASFDDSSDVHNPWSFAAEGNEIRRENLRCYFENQKKIKTNVLMVGEAPGYRGCGRSGIPFTSERTICENPYFYDDKRFRIETKSESPMSEASATIVWNTFDELRFYPVMWSAFPLHPHKEGNLESNRPPRIEEVELGLEFLREVMSLFEIKRIITVGRVAETMMKKNGYAVYPVRHPSHGGARKFAEGLKTFCESY